MEVKRENHLMNPENRLDHTLENHLDNKSDRRTDSRVDSRLPSGSGSGWEMRTITPEVLPRVRKPLIRFLQQHGDRRITRRGIDWLQALAPEALGQEGNLVLVALQERKAKGVLAVADHGKKESFIAVHRAARQQGVAVDLLNEALSSLGKIYGRVALDNLPSLKMCFAIGMVAIQLVTGTTGKPTLWLAEGDWDRKEILRSTYDTDL